MSGKAVREMLAALGVIASLVFVGLEIRQNTAVARGQTRQDLAALNQEWLVLNGQDAEWNDIWRRGWRDDEELSESEASRAVFMMIMNLRRMENVYLQYEEGLVDESALGSYGFNAGGRWFASDRFREWWRGTARRGYDPDFVSFFEAEYDLAP